MTRRFCIAPMMAYTDRHFRFLLRLLTKHAYLYTEMITAQAILRGDRRYLLSFSPIEHPVAIQLGGSDPKLMAHAASIAVQYGYDEINLNIGCPSERVQSGCFGAALMKTPDLVADIFSRTQDAVNIPVTIKTRLGVDDCDSENFLMDFVGKIAERGCRVFILHARKAWLKGLSPKQNRTIPPLHYDRVYKIKKLFPQLEIIINGGIDSHTAAQSHLSHVDGVMIGRMACRDPYALSNVDQLYFNSKEKIISRETVLDAYAAYMIREAVLGVPMSAMQRHITSTTWLSSQQ